MELELPELHEAVKALDQVIDVDYYLPGCAPPPDLILDAINALLGGELPQKGAVLAPDKALCDTCPRKESKPDELRIHEIKRIPFTDISKDKCFLAEGVICMGPATRSGCGERCINAHMPCRGCFGPPKDITDQGAKFLSAFSAIIESEDEEQIKRIMNTVIDPAGLFYMYSLSSSIGMKFLDKERY
jgi:F420-non-reducing hydrogenase small subunit